MTRYKIRYDERKEAGLCVRCGKTPPIENETQCAECKSYFAAYRQNLTQEQRQQRTKTGRDWQNNNPERIKRRNERYRSKLRKEVLSHYGTVCQCCGESHPAFMTIDHINGGGNEHRRQLLGAPVSGNAFYRKIRALGFPEGLQVLCWNCNMARAHYGVCPHQVSK